MKTPLWNPITLLECDNIQIVLDFEQEHESPKDH